MEVEEAVLVEVGVDGHRHVVANAHHGTEGVGAKTHVGILTHHLERLALLLHGISVVAQTVDFQLRSLNLTSLSGTLTLDQRTLGTNAGTSGNLLQQLLVKLLRADHNLHVLDGRAIVQRNKVYRLARAVGTHPALHAYLFSIVRTLQYVNYLCSFHSLFSCYVCCYARATN